MRADILASIPAPSVRDLELGPLDIRLYALCLLAGVVVATWVTMIRWKEQGGDPDLVLEVALWSVLFGLIGGRLYHVITSWDQLGDEWYAPFAIWEGGLGIWGGVALGVVAGAYVTHRRGASVLAMMDAAAPGILIAQGIGRLGNYFNQELFGGPTDLPWGLEVDPSERPGRLPGQPHVPPHLPLRDAVELRRGGADHLGRQALPHPAARGLLPLRGDLLAGADLLGAAPRSTRRTSSSGSGVNFYVALVLFVGAIAFFVWSQRRPADEEPVQRGPAPAPDVPRTPGGRARPARKRA